MNDQPSSDSARQGGSASSAGNAQRQASQQAGDQSAGPATSPPAPTSPGDEAPPGTPGTGENVCPTCGGSGKAQGGECPTCSGTGKVITGIGGA